MPSGKIGSLVYDVVADSTKFLKSIGVLKRQATGFQKMLEATRTPLEKMQSDLDGVALIAGKSVHKMDALSRTVGALSVETKGGGREARRFAEELRRKANAIGQAHLGTKRLTEAEKERQQNLRKLASETEKEIANSRQALAVKRRAELQERRAAKVTRQREELLRRVNSTIQRSITPMQKLGREQVNLTAAYKKGVITSKQYLQAMRMIRKEQDELKRPTKNTTTVVGQANGMFLGMAKNLVGVTLAYKAARLAQEAFSQSLELERAEKQFEVFTGSAKVATGLTEQLRAFGRQTPLTFQGGAQAVKTLLQYGVAQDIVIDRMRRLADISGGSLESLQRLSLAFGQITANGRLQGQELRQLVEAGFNPLQSISKRTGESMEVLRKRMADGNLGIDEMTQALVDATSEGGRFNDMLNEIGSETNFGRIQRLAGLLKDMAAQKITPLAEKAGTAADVIASSLSGGASIFSQRQQLQSMIQQIMVLEGFKASDIAKVGSRGHGAIRELQKQGGNVSNLENALERMQDLQGFSPKNAFGVRSMPSFRQNRPLSGLDVVYSESEKTDLKRRLNLVQNVLDNVQQRRKLQTEQRFAKERGMPLPEQADVGNKLTMEQIKQIGIAAAQKTKDAFKPLVNTLGRKLPNAFAPTISLFKETPPLLKQAFELQRADNEQRRQSEQDAATAAKDRLQAEMDRFREESQQRKEAIEKSSVAAKSFQGGSVEEFNFLRDKQLQADKIEAERKIAQEESQQRESLNQELIEALKEIFGNNQQAPEIGVI